MIEVADLQKRYGSVSAVDGLSFTVRPGRVTGFLGPNGAGKTTTLRVVLGLDAPSAGSALVEGRPYAEMTRPLHRVGALLDANAAHPGRSGWCHLRSIAQSNGIAKRRVTEVLELVGMDQSAHLRFKGFSLGMRQRLGIATALLGDASVLIFDEPTNGLDPEGIHWIRGLFKSLAAEGRTVFVSSHLMSEMALTADHLIIIGRGRLLADTPTDSFVAQNGQKDVLVRSPAPEALRALLNAHRATVQSENDGALAVTGLDAPTIADLAAKHVIAIHELVARTGSLEDAYLALTGQSVEHHGGDVAGTKGAIR